MRTALLLASLLVTATPATAAEGDAILGLWRTDPTDKGYAHVEISRQGEVYSGEIVWLSEPDFPPGDPDAGQPKVDRLNPDPQLRGRPILGLPLVSGFSYAGDGRWRGGVIYDPENGRTYRCKAQLTAGDRLEVRGFVGISLLGRTTVWTRVEAGG